MKVYASKVKMILVSNFLQLLLAVLGVAFYTLLERKWLGYVQTRKGPNKPLLLGLFVPFADALKLVTKEIRIPHRSNKTIYIFVPCLTLFLPFRLWVIYPTVFTPVTLKYSALYFLCLTSVSVYAVLGAGWCSNRRYTILGAVRSVAQSVSYEVSFALIIVHWIVFYFFSLLQTKYSPLGTFIFMIMALLMVSALAETNRSPFDFSEGESELVRGFNTEFRSVSFVMIFLAEYLSIVFISMVIRAIFNMSGFLDLYAFLFIWAVTFIWVRGTIPRLRYDQLMYIAWKSFLPIALCRVCITLVM